MTPDTADTYQHRVGRTGPGSSASWRVDQAGEALTLAQPASRPMPSGRYPLTLEDEPIVRQIERLLGVPFRRQRLAEFNYGGFNPESRPTGGNGQAPKAPPKGNGAHQQAGHPSRRQQAPSKRGLPSQRHRAGGQGHRRDGTRRPSGRGPRRRR